MVQRLRLPHYAGSDLLWKGGWLRDSAQVVEVYLITRVLSARNTSTGGWTFHHLSPPRPSPVHFPKLLPNAAPTQSLPVQAWLPCPLRQGWYKSWKKRPGEMRSPPQVKLSFSSSDQNGRFSGFLKAVSVNDTTCCPLWRRSLGLEL